MGGNIEYDDYFLIESTITQIFDFNFNWAQRQYHMNCMQYSLIHTCVHIL